MHEVDCHSFVAEVTFATAGNSHCLNHHDYLYTPELMSGQQPLYVLHALYARLTCPSKHDIPTQCWLNCWVSFADDGPALNQHWVSVS